VPKAIHLPQPERVTASDPKFPHHRPIGIGVPSPTAAATLPQLLLPKTEPIHLPLSIPSPISGRIGRTSDPNPGRFDASANFGFPSTSETKRYEGTNAPMPSSKRTTITSSEPGASLRPSRSGLLSAALRGHPITGAPDALDGQLGPMRDPEMELAEGEGAPLTSGLELQLFPPRALTGSAAIEPLASRANASERSSFLRSFAYSSPEMTLVQRGSLERGTTKIVQRSIGGSARPAATPHSTSASPRGRSSAPKSTSGAEVNALAAEVWTILRRRLSFEAERHGLR
jgi:hypothetical protein